MVGSTESSKSSLHKQYGGREFLESPSPSLAPSELSESIQQNNLFRSSSNGSQIQAISKLDNTLGSAVNVGALNGSRTFSNYVGSTDTHDYYRFSLGTTSNLNVSLTGLSADADMELSRDTNADGVINYGEGIKYTYGYGTASESMVLDPIAAGTYYLQVYQSSGNTNYNLKLQSTTVTDNSLATARNLSTLSGTRTFSDFVGSTDRQDYYRFSLSTTSNLNLSLTELSADADMGLSRDTNANGIIDYGETIKYTFGYGTASESIVVDPLAAGTYYLQVYQSSGSTNYNLKLQSTPATDNSLATAKSFGTLNGTTTTNGYVGSTDTQDFYRFRLSSTSNLNLSLAGLSADADMELSQDKNGNGVIEYSETIKTSYGYGTTSESMVLDPLAAGLYFLQVYQSSGNTNYNLSLTATTVTDNSLATARNLGTLTGTRTFSDRVASTDTHDYYRFNLGTTSNLNVSLSGLSADANLELSRDSNGNGIIEYSEVIKTTYSYGTIAESVLIDPMAAGTYYLEVYQSSGNTNYNLGLTATAVTDNSLATARNLGTLTGTRTFSDRVASTDMQDFYRFSFSNISNLQLSLTGLSADADLELIRDTNANGVVDYGEQLKVSELSNAASETINYFGMAAGTYYVRVYQSSGSTNYNLKLTQSPSDGFNNEYGYGLVNAAAAVANALGQSPYADVPNQGGNNWGWEMVNAPEVWARGYTGQGVVVAVVDTGVDYNNSDLNANIWRNSDEVAGNGIDDDRNGYVDDIRGWDFVDTDNNPMDLQSHGTHVSGTIAGEKNGVGVTGVAYNARIMPIRVLDAGGSGTEADVAAGIRYAANNGADVINLSLGGGYDSQMEAAVRYATEKGSVVVMAAGNEGSEAPGYPARHATQWGIAVGAVDKNKQLADFSNRAGTVKMDYIVAPGVDVYSTVLNNAYAEYSGTSMATPHVAGVAALLLSAKNTLTPTQVENILIKTAKPNGITA